MLLKDFAWKAFERTGSIEAYLLCRAMEEENRQCDETKITEDEVAISS